ncbi:MAG: 50S ribosomal protein L25/general stress protein Ctc [Desulfobacteraceae bacterium 4572_89]|nr:MAG: 50S ribosomal protein L25/general stress protein Ctc [Desulfobacteraceae bacterium 4572_89]
MELIELNAKIRENKGKGAAKKLRRSNAIPAIVYGVKKEPVMLSLDTIGFDKILRENGSTGLFFNLNIEGSKKKAVMLKDIQMDAFQLEYLHVDLHEIDMDTEVSVMIPVETTGESKGVKEGGMLQIIRRELEVVCKPVNTPDSIVIDVSALDVGDAVHVEDIDLGDDIEIPHEVDFTVLTVVPPTAEEIDDVEEDEDDLMEEVDADADADAEPVSE